MNKRLYIILLLVFATILTLLIEIWHVALIEEHVLFWGIGMVVLASVIAMLAGKRKAV